MNRRDMMTGTAASAIAMSVPSKVLSATGEDPVEVAEKLHEVDVFDIKSIPEAKTIAVGELQPNQVAYRTYVDFNFLSQKITFYAIRKHPDHLGKSNYRDEEVFINRIIYPRHYEEYNIWMSSTLLCYPTYYDACLVALRDVADCLNYHKSVVESIRSSISVFGKHVNEEHVYRAMNRHLIHGESPEKTLTEAQNMKRIVECLLA